MAKAPSARATPAASTKGRTPSVPASAVARQPLHKQAIPKAPARAMTMPGGMPMPGGAPRIPGPPARTPLAQAAPRMPLPGPQVGTSAPSMRGLIPPPYSLGPFK